MSGHEFEKQVRQKLNDLKMTPSAGSWETIENKLRKRKHRPAAFYWLPLLIIGLAAGGYLFLNNDRSNNDQKTVLSDKNSTHNVKAQPKISDVNTSRSGSTRVVDQNPTVSRGVLPDAPERESAKEQASGGFFRNVKQGTQTHRDEKSTSADVSSAAQQKDIGTQQTNPTVTQEKSATGRSLSLKISSYPIGAITPSPLIFAQNEKKSQAKKLNKWSYGLSAFAGMSAVNEGHFLNFNNAQVEDVSLVPSFAPRPSYKASSIEPGIAYSGGLFVKRELNRKFSLSLGVNYLQLNTRSKVGDREYGSQVVNAGASGYQFVYSYFRVERDKPSEYHNRYHFIEVPVELHTRLNKSEKTPVLLTTGVAVSQLLKSNSLHFDGTTGVYYKDDRLLNQTQIAAKSGVSIGILNKTTRPLWIGPSAKYNVSKILKKDVSARTNFMSIGIDVKMFIQ